MTVLRRRVFTGLFAVFMLALTAPATFAHAALVESDPADGAGVAAPSVLVFRFDEELKPVESTVTVRDGSGTVVAEGGIVDDDFTMVVELPAVPVGGYLAHWIAITADDNGKTQGNVTFTVVAGTPPPTATPESSAPPSVTPPPSAAPTPTVTVGATASPAPSPAPGPSQPAGSELILPLFVVGALVVALVWFLLRRRSS